MSGCQPGLARLSSRIPMSPCLRVSASPRLRVSASPRLRVSASPCFLGQELLYYISLNIGQAELPALETVGELGVVQTHQVEDRGVQVVDMNPVLDGVVAQLVGGAHRGASFYSASGQPHRECP